jgi:hypothetical protein
VKERLLKKENKYTIAMVVDQMPFYFLSKLSNPVCNIFCSYGFAIMDNKYDSFPFKIKLNVNLEEEIQDMRMLLPDPRKEED